MDTGERLAAYLAGELDTDESRALEAELARAPALRAQLARLRRLEDALGTLPAPTPPQGLRERLHAAVQDELDRQHLPDTRNERAQGTRDELAARRQRSIPRGLPDWLPALAGAAAVLVLIVGAVTLLPASGGDDAADTLAGGATQEAADSGDAAAMSAPEASTSLGPVIRADGAAYDPAGLDALALDDRFAGIVEQALSGQQAEAAAQRYRAPLAGNRSFAADEGSDDAGATTDDSGESDGARPPEPAPLQIIGPVAEEDLADVQRCLEGILAGDDTLIPVYAELATFEQEPVIVYGILSRDPGPGTYTRVELWTVGRADCEVRYFTQADRATG